MATLLLGLLFSLALSYGVIESQLGEKRRAFVRDSQAATQDYRYSLREATQLLTNFELLFESSSFVSEEEFLRFVRPQMSVGGFVGVAFLGLLDGDNPYTTAPPSGHPHQHQEPHQIAIGEGDGVKHFVYRYMAHLDQEMQEEAPGAHLLHVLGDNYQQAIAQVMTRGELALGGMVGLTRENDTLVIYQPVFNAQGDGRKLLGILAVLLDPMAAVDRVQASQQLDVQLTIGSDFAGESRCCDSTPEAVFSTLRQESDFVLSGTPFHLVYQRLLSWQDAGLKWAVVAFLLGMLVTFFAHRLRVASAERLTVLQERNRVIRRKVDEQTQSLRQSSVELQQQKAALDEHAIVSIADTGGSITYVNDRFCEISGYTRDELIGRNHRLIKSDRHPASFYEEMWTTISQGRVWQGEICNRARNGNEYWVRSTIVPFLDSRGVPYQYVSIRTDISEVKAVTQSLQARERELDTILNTVPALIWFKDREGRILRANRQAAHLMNCLPSEVEGRFIDEFFPEDAERYRLADQQVMESGEPLLGEMEEKELPTGHYFLRLDRVPFADEQGNVAGVVVMAVDVTRQQETERALFINEERLRRSQGFANIGTWDWNIQSGELYWSDRIAPLFGYEVGALETTYENFLNAVHPDDRELVTSAVGGCVETGAEYNIEHRVVWPDGQVRWLSEKGDVVRDESGAPMHMLGVVTDIHERKMAEMALRESEAALSENEEKFRSLYELSPVGIALNGLEGEFLDANQSFHDIVGYTAAECRQLSYWQLTPEEYAAQETAQLESLEKFGRYGPYEKEYIHKDGHRVAVLLNGTIVHDREGNQRIWSIVQDISERKQVEEQLNRFKTTLDVTKDCVFMFDPEAMHFFYVNQGAMEQVGYSQDELMAMHPYDIKPDFDEAAFRELLAPLIEQGGGSTTFEARHRHKEGYDIPVEIALQYIAPEGEPPRFVAIVRNITERKVMQEKLVQAKEAAEQASKAKSEFLSSMSHELRTPMNAILGFAQLLQGDENLTAEQHESLHDIANAGTHLLELINGVLDLAKIEAGKMELSISTVVIGDVMTAGKSLIGPMAEKRDIQMIFSSACMDGGYVRADFTRTKQVLLNLLSNAVKYNRQGGRIEVDCQMMANNRLRISVSDTGKGIAEAKLKGLFEAFNRLDAEGGSVEGTGIGLVITRQLVELMGGRIGVESVVNEGSTFWFELPMAQHDGTKRERACTEVIASDQGLGAGRTVLYIEDNPVNLKLVAKLIEKRTAIRLLSAEEPVRGIELAMEQQPDLILLDINLPEMSGYEVLRHLRDMEQTRDIPVVALSANAMANDLQKGEAAGFNGYLTKPINVKEFFAVVAAMLGESEGV
jgi:PAS domain S-box-containing protein